MAEINENTPYDDVYRTLLNDCTELIIPVVNEIFHEQYTGKEKIIALPDIHFMNQQGGKTKEKITDSCFEIQSDEKRKYHIECQSTPDGSMMIRFFEYDSQIALDHGEIENYKLTVIFPKSAVLYLRHTYKTPEEMLICIQTPGGEVSYGIPVMKVQTYSLEAIFEKNLLFLLPYYIFGHEKQFSEYENNAEKMQKLKSEYQAIRMKLESLCGEGRISEYEKCAIIDMMKKVIDKIAAKYEQIRKEVKSAMGGKVLEYEAKTILRQGITQGISQGEIKSLIEMIQKKLKKNYSVLQIAKEVEESEGYVQEICDIIQKAGLDSDIEKMIDAVLVLREQK